MKKYVSGKITDLTEAEFREAFGRGCALVLSMGDTPVNPLEVGACLTEDCNGDGTGGVLQGSSSYLHAWSCYIKHDLIAMLECDSIAMLPNWTTSRGANFEKYVAEKCNMPVEYISGDYRSLDRQNDK